jgi:CelD/BcsL family acetyltransferase involved in cellulose biosynthesis
MVQVETVRTLDALEPLRDEWNVLADRAESPLLRHEWFASCARAFSADGDLRVVTIRRSQQLVGIAPLAFRRSMSPAAFLPPTERHWRCLLTRSCNFECPSCCSE